MNNIPVIDWVFIFLGLIMIVHGYIKGFIEELFSWAALILAIWVGVLLNTASAGFIREKFMQNVRIVPEILGFLAIFAIIMIAVKLLEHVLKEVIEGANLGTINKVLGAFFGLIEGLAFTALIIFVLQVQPLFNANRFLAESIFARLMLQILKLPLHSGEEAANAVFLILPPVLKPTVLIAAVFKPLFPV